MQGHCWRLLILTRYFVFQLLYTIKKQGNNLPRSEYEQERIKPDPYDKFDAKTGAGSSIKIEAVYCLKHLAFMETINDKALLLGFKYDQQANLREEKQNNGKTSLRVVVTKEGYYPKPAKTTVASKASSTSLLSVTSSDSKPPPVAKQTPEQMDALKASIYDSYFSLQEQIQTHIRQQRRFTYDRVRFGGHHLLVDFANEGAMLSMKETVEKIRAELRTEQISGFAERI